MLLPFGVLLHLEILAVASMMEKQKNRKRKGNALFLTL